MLDAKLKSLTLLDLESILVEIVDDEKKEKEIVEKVKERLKEEEDNKPEPKKNVKWDTVILSIKDKEADEDENEDEQEFLRYIVKVPEGTDHSEIPNSLRATIRNHNSEAKTAKSKVSDLVYGIEKVSKKKFKEGSLEIKVETKIPVITVLAENTLEPK